jgi:hypothetical protein
MIFRFGAGVSAMTNDLIIGYNSDFLDEIKITVLIISFFAVFAEKPCAF